MKANTLLSLTAALILAIGAAAGARALGLFERGPAAAAPAPIIQVLVARANLYEGISITPDMVMVRPLRAGEQEFFNKNRDKFLPTRVEAAALRTPIRNIPADQPILKTDLEDLEFPEDVRRRLAPNTRAINLLIPAERSAGGLITKGDRVDVLLTSQVCDGNDCGKSRTLSAYIARDMKVIVKRNQLWTVLRANPANQPIAYTLEANPYRAALIEFALNKGTITLMPTDAPRESRGIRPVGAELQPISFAIPNSPEYQDEDERVAKIQRGEYSVSDGDLERIFRLRPIVRTPPPAPQPPPPPPIVIQSIRGVQMAGNAAFDRETGGRYNPPPKPKLEKTKPVNNPVEGAPVVAGATDWMGYVFHRPAGAPTAGGRPAAPT